MVEIIGNILPWLGNMLAKSILEKAGFTPRSFEERISPGKNNFSLPPIGLESSLPLHIFKGFCKMGHNACGKEYLCLLFIPLRV